MFTMKTLMDVKFDKFVEAIKEAQQKKESKISFEGTEVEFEILQGLEHLGDIRIKGVTYSLVPELASKSKLAKDGILGPRVVEDGKRRWQTVQSRLNFEHYRAKRDLLIELWGDLSKVVIRINNRATRSPKIAKVTSRWVEKFPGRDLSQRKELKEVGEKLPYLNDQDWENVISLVQAINKAKARRQ